MPTWMPQWFVEGVLLLILAALFLGLYWLANKMLANELQHLMAIVKSEWEDSKRSRFTVGSMNWRGFIAIFIFGLIVMVFTSGQKLIGLIGSVVGLSAAETLVAATNFLSMFFFLACWLLVSVIAVVVDRRGRSRKS